MLKSAGMVQTFDEDLFGAIVDRVIVGIGWLTFGLKDGRKREVEM